LGSDEDQEARNAPSEKTQLASQQAGIVSGFGGGYFHKEKKNKVMKKINGKIRS